MEFEGARIEMNNPITAFLIAGIAAGIIASDASAHDPDNPFPDIEVHRNASDKLLATYPFDLTPIVRVTDTGFAGLHAAIEPGFVPGEDDASNGLFAIPLATTVGLELLAVEPGLQIRIDGTTLDSPGETTVIGTHDDADRGNSDLHEHGEFQFLINPNGERAFAEGEIHFRLYDTGGAHAPSDPRKLRVSNGYLPSPASPDNGTNKCLKAVAKEAGKFMRSTHSTLAKCLTLADAIVNLGNSANAAPKNCGLDETSSSTMIGRIERARTKAFEKIDRSCGPLSSVSTPFTLAAVEAHLDMHRCRAEETVAATYDNARDLVSNAIEAALAGSACVGNVCVGGIANGNSCNDTEECKTKTLVSNATVCLHEAAVAE
jgi:hypothetical protein